MGLIVSRADERRVGAAPLLGVSEAKNEAGEARPLAPFEPGGSNYCLYSAGDYLNDPEAWYKPLTLRPVIGLYHLAPTLVRRQLREMYAQGQRRIALVLWHSDFTPDERLVNEPVFGHVVNSRMRELLPQHRANLRALLTDIRTVGFRELVLRVAPTASSDPQEWTAWEEARYQTNWRFLVSTRSLVEQAFAGYSAPVWYDLGLELGGIQKGQARQYQARLWKDYITHFRAVRTVGFSFAVAPGRLPAAIAAFDEAGVRPPAYALDIYEGALQHLSYIRDELRTARQLDQPLIIQEAYYDDPVTAAEVKKARQELQLNIRTLYQWPLKRGATQKHFSMHYPPGFSAYRSLVTVP